MKRSIRRRRRLGPHGVVALWFLVVDSLAGRPFHTPAALAASHHPCLRLAMSITERCRTSLRTARSYASSDPRSRFAPAVHLELLQNIVNVVLHGRHLDPQPLGDLLVREALVDEPHDLALSVGETRWDSIGAAIGRESGDPAKQRARYPG